MSAFRPKYAMNLQFDLKEFVTYLRYLGLLCTAFTALNFLASWEIEASWLGFGLAFLNYNSLGRVFGVKSPEKTLLKARVVLDGSPEVLARAF